MPGRYEIRLSGAGGQGLLLAGLILAEAAVLDGKNAAQTQSYGPEARGGASKSEVIISDEEIDFPKVIQPDLLLALTQEACDKYYHELKKSGLLVVDSFHVKRLPTSAALSIPITPIAKQETGKEIVANIVSLGIIVELTNIVSHEVISKAVLAKVPKGTEELNAKALEAGFKVGANYKNLLKR